MGGAGCRGGDTVWCQTVTAAGRQSCLTPTVSFCLLIYGYERVTIKYIKILQAFQVLSREHSSLLAAAGAVYCGVGGGRAEVLHCGTKLYLPDLSIH